MYINCINCEFGVSGIHVTWEFLGILHNNQTTSQTQTSYKITAKSMFKIRDQDILFNSYDNNFRITYSILHIYREMQAYLTSYISKSP